MSTSFSLRLTRGLALAAALLLVQGFATSSAEASCGSYVMVGGHHSGEEHIPAAYRSGERQSSVPFRMPCQGPSCSRAPKDLPAAPAPQITFSGEQWACIANLAAKSTAEPRVALMDTHCVDPLHRASGIFHPPR